MKLLERVRDMFRSKKSVKLTSLSAAVQTEREFIIHALENSAPDKLRDLAAEMLHDLTQSEKDDRDRTVG